MIALGYFPSRSGDIYVLVKPNYYFGSPHGAPYEYDLHVPLIFYGHGIAPGRYDRKVLTFDLAPTLAEIAGVKLPAVPGKPLTEAFKKE
jgi:arylsulfatase A-like enzyme